MVLIGLSILMVSILFMYFRHLPKKWSIPTWTRLNRDLIISHTRSDDVSRKLPQDTKINSVWKEDIMTRISNNENHQSDVKDGNALLDMWEISDSKAMPPPPLPGKKATSLPTNSSSADNKGRTQSPNSNVGDKNDENLYTSSLLPGDSSQFSSSSHLSRVPTSLAPSPTQLEKQKKSVKKVVLEPGHSPLDWARLANSNADLSGLGGGSYIKVPTSLLSKQTGRKGKDAWTVLGGKVYNITPYLPFHPGGKSELLRSAGRDGTKLFTEVHPWVNWEGMLASCLVGIAVEENEAQTQINLHEMD